MKALLRHTQTISNIFSYDFFLKLCTCSNLDQSDIAPGTVTKQTIFVIAKALFTQKHIFHYLKVNAIRSRQLFYEKNHYGT